MANNDETRQYEAIVFGATGYTGKYTAEHITTSLPTDFKWAVAGRSRSKLEAVVEELKALNPDRALPAIETAELEKDDLVALAKKTKVLITTVGPYFKYGTKVVEACAETGTHYIDVTGEVPWVADMIRAYDSVAKKTGAIMIPQCGVESAPGDLIAWILVSHIRKTLNVGTRELIEAIHELKGAPSGGTLATALGLLGAYSLVDFAKSGKPYALSAVPQPADSTWNPGARPLREKLTGIRRVKELGILTTSIAGPADIPIVGRSWSLYDGGKYYGTKFRMSPYIVARNLFSGITTHLLMTFGFLTLALPPVRWLLKKFVYKPGEGPTKEEAKNDRLEWRSIAEADTADPANPKRAFLNMAWEGNLYHLTGVLIAEAAITISRDKTHAHELGGGMVTPATLGAPFLERLNKAGLKTEVHTMP